jgi:hypothetical protein
VADKSEADGTMTQDLIAYAEVSAGGKTRETLRLAMIFSYCQAHNGIPVEQATALVTTAFEDFDKRYPDWEMNAVAMLAAGLLPD